MTSYIGAASHLCGLHDGAHAHLGNRSLPRAGATSAAILAALEPLVTVVLAGLVVGDRRSPVQLAGGAPMLGAVVTLAVRVAPSLPNRGEVAPCPQ